MAKSYGREENHSLSPEQMVFNMRKNSEAMRLHCDVRDVREAIVEERIYQFTERYKDTTDFKSAGVGGFDYELLRYVRAIISPQIQSLVNLEIGSKDIAWMSSDCAPQFDSYQADSRYRFMRDSIETALRTGEVTVPMTDDIKRAIALKTRK